MPRALLLALLAIGLTTGCATSPSQSAQPMPPRMLPTACLQPCPALPMAQGNDEAAVAVWMFDVIDAAGTCRRMHEICRSAAMEN